MASQIRQNFHSDVEAAINKQINMELYNSYVYLSMSAYFDRDDVAFPGLRKYCKEASEEEREHAEKFIRYQNRRGGRVVFNPIDKPGKDEWGSPLEALQSALELEKATNQSLLDLHALATDHNDAQCCDFLESEFLEHQAKDIKKLGNYITQLKRVGAGLGEYTFDRNVNDSDDDS